MEFYTKVAYDSAKLLTERYSSSFSTSSVLYTSSIRPHIYAIYGMVRVADEIVDSYRGVDTQKLLDEFEAAVYQSMRDGFSTNPILHAFACTAKNFSIDHKLIAPFFASMRVDAQNPKAFSQKEYENYIYGSAVVVGLMCLSVFVEPEHYETLQPGAEALARAYQKVNFLRDMRADYEDLGRVYFPNVDYMSFTDEQRQTILHDITHDFELARPVIDELPQGVRRAVRTSYELYWALFQQLRQMDVARMRAGRHSVPRHKKIQIYTKARIGL